MKKTKQKLRRRSDAGITLIETLLAGTLLTIGSLGMVGLVVGSIATNNRNKIDSTQTMLAESIVEHVNSTLIGSEQSLIADCEGHSYTIDTLPGGANLTVTGSAVNFAENIAADTSKANYHMDYYVKTPCSNLGKLQAIYDVRWNVQLVGAGTASPTNTYLLTVSAKLKNHGEGNMFFSSPVTLRVMSGN